MDEIIILALQGSPWAFVALLGFVIRGLYLKGEKTHKDYSEAMALVQEERRKEAVEMSDKFSAVALGVSQNMAVLTSAVQGLNGGR